MASFYSWVICVSAAFLVAMTKHLARSKLREDGFGSKFGGIQSIVLWRHISGVWASCSCYLPKDQKRADRKWACPSNLKSHPQWFAFSRKNSASWWLHNLPNQHASWGPSIQTHELCGDILCWNCDKMFLTMSLNSSKYQKSLNKQVIFPPVLCKIAA